MERLAIIGLGRFGNRLAELLAKAGAEVIAVDRDRDLVETVRDMVTVAVCLDSTDAEALKAQGIDQVDAAVVGIGTGFEDAALTTAVLKKLGVPKVISRAGTEIRGQILSNIGADEIANPEEESAQRWAGRLLAPAIMERIALAEGYSLAQVPAPEEFHSKTLRQLDVGRKYKVLVVAIRRTAREGEVKDTEAPAQELISAPSPDIAIQPNDVLVIIGSDEAIEEFSRK